MAVAHLLPSSAPRPVRSFVALGDSTTVGLGDPLPDGGWRGWAALLAHCLDPGGRGTYANLARTGARMADVARQQLPEALALRPDVAAMVVGMNDTLRSDFDPDRMRADLRHVASSLEVAGTTLMTVRLHDHARVFKLPGPLRRPLQRRIALVNEVIDDIAGQHGLVCLDLDEIPETYESASWSVDRLHPGERGHRMLARWFAEALLAKGYRVPVLPGLDPEGGLQTTTTAHLWWLLSQGVPWLGRRGRDLLPHALAVAARDVLGRPPRALGSPPCLDPMDAPLTNYARSH